MKTSNLKNQKSIVENNNDNENFIPLKAPPKEFIVDSENFKKFCELKIEDTSNSIDRNDLPSEFSEETCEFIDMFRQKTANENNEWNFYIDYEKNEIIHCIYGDPTEVTGWINRKVMANRKILTIHNHIKGTYSAPSPANFEILEYCFENYEIICAEGEFWILEFKGSYDPEWVNDFKEEIQEIFDYCDSFRKIDSHLANRLYTNRLTNYINNNYENILICKKEYEK